MSGAIVGTGIGVAVSVGGGGVSGVLVAEGVTVGPMEIGTPLQAVNDRTNRNPTMVWMRFMRVLILVNKRGVNSSVLQNKGCLLLINDFRYNKFSSCPGGGENAMPKLSSPGSQKRKRLWLLRHQSSSCA